MASIRGIQHRGPSNPHSVWSHVSLYALINLREGPSSLRSSSADPARHGGCPSSSWACCSLSVRLRRGLRPLAYIKPRLAEQSSSESSFRCPDQCWPCADFRRFQRQLGCFMKLIQSVVSRGQNLESCSCKSYRLGGFLLVSAHRSEP